MCHALHTLFHYAASKSHKDYFFILSFNCKAEENLGNVVFGLQFELRTNTTQETSSDFHQHVHEISMYNSSPSHVANFFSKFPASTQHLAKLTL